MRHLDRPLALLATLALSTACAGIESVSPSAATTGVEALIGDAACDVDAQCHTVGVGAKACGGPQRYLAWSSLRTDDAALKSAAAREANLARARARDSGLMSNCAVVIDPGAYCGVRDAVAGRATPSTTAQPPATRQCKVRASGAGGARTIY